MLPWNPNLWTEEYLASLIGQPESGELEYKSGKALARRGDREKFVREQLSPTVSAFANSEGGIIIIGIAEDREKTPRVAKEIDGFVVCRGEAVQSPEDFQRIVESCIRPNLSGIRLRQILLSGPVAGRSVFAVYVPQGTTAYQAEAHKYYARSEFETKSMPDHEVRLRMLRGRTPRGHVEVHNCNVLTADEEWAARQAKHQKILDDRERGNIIFYGRGVPPLNYFETPKRDYDEWSFRLVVVNSGELTIRDFLLSLAFTGDIQVDRRGATWDGQDKVDRGVDGELRWRFAGGVRKTTNTPMGEEYTPPESKLFPNDRAVFPNEEWLIHAPVGSPLKSNDVTLRWTIYLDDAPPSLGEIDLIARFQDTSLAEPNA